MNIDASNLIQFSFNQGKTDNKYNFDEKKANEDFQKIQGLLRQLDSQHIDGINSEDENAMEISEPDTSRFDRYDRLEFSEKGNNRYKEIKLIWGSELDYTKDKAIDNAWINSQNTMFRLYGNSGRVSDEAVVGMSRGDFAEYMKTHELDKEIDWNAADMLTYGSCQYDKFSEFTDYVGALCASLENRIKTDFSGDEQTEQLENLNKLFDKAVSEVISNTAAYTEYVFDDLGASLPEGKLEASIRQVMMDKKNAYGKFIEDNSDYAGINDGEDKWLRRDIGYMANALRNAFTPDKTSSNNDTWNENDILVIGMMSTLHSGEVGDMGRLASINRYNDEESLGLTLANTWLREQKILSTYEPSDDIKGVTDDLFGKYAERVIHRADLAVDVTKRGTVGTKASQFAPIDRDAVFAVVDVAKKTYAETGDEKTALVKSAEFARNTFLEKSKTSNLWRYKNDFGTNAKKYWESFYDQKTIKTYHDPSGAKTMMARWLRFEETVGSMEKFFKRNGFGAVPSSEYKNK
ncbi:MAG: hypothetical protein IK990_02055 [Ruminiclostridium sp.]|nr:hypothetical protein [Ruminiclostridium sp.]